MNLAEYWLPRLLPVIKHALDATLDLEHQRIAVANQLHTLDRLFFLAA